MKHWQLAGWAVVGLVGMGLGTGAALAGETQGEARSPEVHLPEGSAGSETGREPSATTVADWVAQIEAALVQITAVRIETTEAGLQLVLETAEGRALAAPTTQTVGNALIADIPNAVLALPEGGAFEQFAPAEGIALVSVTNEPGDRVRVAITGTDAPPVAAVTATGLAVTLGEAIVGAEDEAIQVVVTGEQDEGYNPSNTSVGTRTDTPLRDVPQSIQVVPQEVLRDQQINRLEDALRNVPGVTTSTGQLGALTSFTIRGFSASGFSGNILRDGLRDPVVGGIVELPNIERVEVLRGPASVLYGYNNPGGTINLVTKQPLRDPFYFIDGTVGSYDFYRGAVDLSGPLNNSRTVLYRLNASYRNSGSFFDFVDSDYLGISPVLSFAISERTSLTLEGEYNSKNTGWYSGQPAIGTVQPNPNGEIQRSRNYGEPDDYIEQNISRVGYRLEHQFSDDWSFRNAFRATFHRYNENITTITGLSFNNQIANRRLFISNVDEDDYILTTDLIGRFSTGSIEHQLLVGVDLARAVSRRISDAATAALIDLFNPVYNQPLLSSFALAQDAYDIRNSLGVYIQDQVTLAENLKLLLGLRFDTFEQNNSNFLRATRINQSGNAFSPRLGIVYQPIEPVSLYASYARSFTPALGTAFDSSIFQPERGTQYEVGVKANLNDGLSATLAFYDLTRSNVLTTDNTPGIPPGFSIQTGEQRSRGVELNLAGEILPGWNIIAGYAYTDAQITQDNTIPVGNRLNNVPENSFNLWTSYELQEGSLKGLGFGAGLFYVGERQGDLRNTFQLPSNLRTDAAIFYNRDQFRLALNFRNLFNVDYFQSALNNLRVYPSEPFTVQGTISWEF